MVRRLISLALLPLLFGIGSLGLASVSSVANAACDPTTQSCLPTTPTAGTPGTQVQGEHFTRFCVHHFAPNNSVTATNESTGATRNIGTDSTGSGCGQVPVTSGCQQITASGPDATGATRTATSRVCVEAAVVHRGSTLPFTGANDVVPGTILGAVLVLLGGGITFLARRKRSTVTA